MAGFIPEEFIETVRDSVNIVDIVSEYVVLKRTGQNFVGLCPFHPEKTPSFTVSPGKQIFYCFGCGAGGNVFSFLMKIENLTFPEAVEVVARRVGLELPDVKKKEKSSFRTKFYELNKLAAKFYHNLLFAEEGKDARNYLLQRGITVESWKEFELGYAPENGRALYTFLEEKGIEKQLLESLGLISVRGENVCDRFRERIIFPIYDTRKRCLGFGGRILGQGEPKYLNSPDTPVFSKSRHLYGLQAALQAIRREGQVIVVEGYLDCITLHQFGFATAVAALGTAFTRDQARLLLRQAKEIVLAFDSDAAGSAASLRSAGLLQELGGEVYILDLPSGKDPDEFLQNYGSEAFSSVLKEKKLLYLEFKFRQLSSQYDAGTVHGRAEIINNLLEDVQKVDDLVVRDGYLQIIAGNLKVSEDSVRSQFYNYLSRLKTKKDRNVKNRDTMGGGKQAFVLPKESAPEVARRALFRISCQDKEVWQKIQEELDVQVLAEGELAPYVEFLQNSGWKGNANLLDFFPEQDQAKLAGLLLEGDDYELEPRNRNHLVADYIRILKKEELTRKIDKITVKLQNCEKTNDLEGIKALLAELNKLYVKLEELKTGCPMFSSQDRLNTKGGKA